MSAPEPIEFETLQVNGQLLIGETSVISASGGVVANSDGPVAYLSAATGKKLMVGQTAGVYGLNVASSSAIFDGRKIDLYSGGSEVGVSVQDGKTIVTNCTVDSSGPSAYVAPVAGKNLILTETPGVSGPNHLTSSAILTGQQFDIYSGGSEIGVAVHPGKTTVTNCTVDSAGPSAYLAPATGKNLILTGTLGSSGPNQAGSSAILTGQQFNVFSGGSEIGLSVLANKTVVTNCTVDSAGPVAFIAPETGKQLVLSESLGVYGPNVATSSVQLSGNSISMYDGGNHPANMTMVNDIALIRNATLTTRTRQEDDQRAFVGNNADLQDNFAVHPGIFDFSVGGSYGGHVGINMMYTTNTVNIVQRTIVPFAQTGTMIALDAGPDGALFEIEAVASSTVVAVPGAYFTIRDANQSNNDTGRVLCKSTRVAGVEQGRVMAKTVARIVGPRYIYVKVELAGTFLNTGSYLYIKRLPKAGAETQIFAGVYTEFPDGA